MEYGQISLVLNGINIIWGMIAVCWTRDGCKTIVRHVRETNSKTRHTCQKSAL